DSGGQRHIGRRKIMSSKIVLEKRRREQTVTSECMVRRRAKRYIAGLRRVTFRLGPKYLTERRRDLPPGGQLKEDSVFQWGNSWQSHPRPPIQAAFSPKHCELLTRETLPSDALAAAAFLESRVSLRGGRST